MLSRITTQIEIYGNLQCTLLTQSSCFKCSKCVFMCNTAHLLHALESRHGLVTACLIRYVSTINMKTTG
ncbi:hypothetical protein CDL12_19152 [Handroanthus impetiginosus]|uniref:Uncharacterized protein n=1 Tax=Handroanthus impetiginosus TaxID=429701 RepID=A0A2G9GST2_9LAMI|nr:hypothetical protein CDL12_19152 [Handroanthus impetiginosus]